jgi:hypothetical protein
VVTISKLAEGHGVGAGNAMMQFGSAVSLESRRLSPAVVVVARVRGV